MQVTKSVSVLILASVTLCLSLSASRHGLAQTRIPETRRVIAILVNLADASVSVTPSQVLGGLESDTFNVNGLYREASFGAIGFDADVAGPYTVANAAVTDCDYYGWAVAAEAAATAAGVDLAQYRHRLFVLPHWSKLPNCSWTGIANTGCDPWCRAWTADAGSPMVAAHELGHNLGLYHAGKDGGGPRDDQSDVMGAAASTWHRFSAPNALIMGWYPNAAPVVQDVTVGGVYTVLPFGRDNVSGPQILRVGGYLISYRQLEGYDTQLHPGYTQGVSIHRELLAPGPTTLMRTLFDSESFMDASMPLTVTQLSHGSSGATVAISDSKACQPAGYTLSASFDKPSYKKNQTMSVVARMASDCGPAPGQELLFQLRRPDGGVVSIVTSVTTADGSATARYKLSGRVQAGIWTWTVSSRSSSASVSAAASVQ